MTTHSNKTLIPISALKSYLQIVPRDVENIIKEYVNIAAKAECKMKYSWKWGIYQDDSRSSWDCYYDPVPRDFITINVTIETRCGESMIKFKFYPDELDQLVDLLMNNETEDFYDYEWTTISDNSLFNHQNLYLNITENVSKMLLDVNAQVNDQLATSKHVLAKDPN